MNQLLVDFEFLKIQVLRHLNGRKWQVKVASNVWNVSYLIRLALNSYSIRVGLEECCRRVSRSQVTQLRASLGRAPVRRSFATFSVPEKETLIGPKEKKKKKKKTSTAVKKALESWTDSGSPTLSTRQESTKRMCSTTGTWRTREKKKEENVSDFSHRDVSAQQPIHSDATATTNLQIVTVAILDHVTPPALGRRWLINGRWMFFKQLVQDTALYCLFKSTF